MSETIRLLYAEDNPSDADLTRAYFANHAPDFNLVIVGSGRACLDHLREHRCDLLLLDNCLPDTDAIDVLKHLQTQRPAPPVVVVTGAGDEELVVRLVRLGAWDYVPKSSEYLERLPDLLRNTLAEHRRRADPAPAARVPQRRILYIERHEIDIDLTSAHFRENADHLALTIVRSSAEALARLAETPVDLILTDLRMPDLNALDLLRELRQRACSVPLIVVTGKGDEMAAVAALKLGAYDYIVKRDGYLTQLPYAIDNAVSRFQLEQLNTRLKTELAEQERGEAERSRLAEELRQVQKIDSLGRLAGGIAHDFNNLLTVIQGQADLILQDLHHEDPLRESVDDIQAAARRAADLTRQLLAFSRRQILHPRVLDLNALLAESTRMLGRLLGEDIELATVYGDKLGLVRADPGQLDQVVVNLAVNARDAMPQGGRLTIQTGNFTVDAVAAERHPSFRAGSYVLLTITDTGSGMSPEVLDRIFEPFFTTKDVGKGTGLGLAMVYGIVKQSGGWIWVSSEPGRGTTFEIYLPRVEEAAAPAEPPPPVSNRRGTETVLVVEDDEGVRKLTCRSLRKSGYQVLEAANGGEALILCEQRRQPIGLLFTDVVMPGMSGPQLVDRLKQLHPEMKVLYTSGYTDAGVVRLGLLDESLDFLQKPFTPGELNRKVREVLDTPPPHS